MVCGPLCGSACSGRLTPLPAACLVTFLLWPFPDQMTRFLFPVLPVLVLYAFWALAAVLRAVGRAPALGHALLALVALSLSVPALAFIQQRGIAGGRYAEMTDWYRRPDLDDARALPSAPR